MTPCRRLMQAATSYSVVFEPALSLGEQCRSRSTDWHSKTPSIEQGQGVVAACVRSVAAMIRTRSADVTHTGVSPARIGNVVSNRQTIWCTPRSWGKLGQSKASGKFSANRKQLDVESHTDHVWLYVPKCFSQM